MKEGVQWAQKFDSNQNEVISNAIQLLHALGLIQGQGGKDLVKSQAGQYSATAMGPGQQIPQLVTFTPTQIIQQFYPQQLIQGPQIQQLFRGFDMYTGIRQFHGFPQLGLFQQAQRSLGYSIQSYRQQGIIEGLSQPPTLVQQPQNHAQEPRYINERLLDSPGKASTRMITLDLL
ncbi:MAG: hypothetical protein EZS28_031880, partial [Streblomastix strix]